MRVVTRLLVTALLVPLFSGFIRAQDQTAYTSADGVVLPVVVKQVKPEYTKDGMQMGIQGSVRVAAVVLSSGTVGEVTVTKSLDREFGLDQAAIDAMKQWEFKPGTREGKPVAVRIECEITFRLK